MTDPTRVSNFVFESIENGKMLNFIALEVTVCFCHLYVCIRVAPHHLVPWFRHSSVLRRVSLSCQEQSSPHTQCYNRSPYQWNRLADQLQQNEPLNIQPIWNYQVIISLSVTVLVYITKHTITINYSPKLKTFSRFI